MRRAILSLFVFPVVVSALIACGSGASNEVSLNGLDGATDVPVNSSFKYTFSGNVDTSTVNASTFFMVELDGAAASVAKSPFDPSECDNTRAIDAVISCILNIMCTLYPNTDLAPHTNYIACLSTDIRYQNGGVFEGFMATFMTAGAAPIFTIGGTAAGLAAGEEVVLQDNGGDDLTITADGTFAFATKLGDGVSYAVTVLTAPAYKTCTVSNGTGTVSGADVTNISVACAMNSYNIGGTAGGLDGTVVLQDNGGDDLTVSANGPFTFATKIEHGLPYNVTVRTQPLTQVCNVTNGSGTVGAADVTDVAVTCNYGGPVIFSTTTASFSGDLGGVTGADWLCESAANRPDSRCYKAMIVDGTNRVACTTPFCGGGPAEHVDWVFAANTSYYRPGLAVRIGTTDANGLFSFPLENAMVADSSLIWSGFTVTDPAPVDWTTGNDCVNWTGGVGDAGSYGASGDTSDHAIAAALAGCDITYANLICVSQ